MAASTEKSALLEARRPKPPPRKVVLIFTAAGSMPSAAATWTVSIVWFWVPTQSSHLPGVTCATAFIGSMQACAR